MYLIYFWIYRISFDDEVWIDCTWIGREIRKVIVKSGDFKVIQVVRTQSRFRSHWNPSECKHLIGDSRRCRDWVKKKCCIFDLITPKKRSFYTQSYYNNKTTEYRCKADVDLWTKKRWIRNYCESEIIFRLIDRKQKMHFRFDRCLGSEIKHSI